MTDQMSITSSPFEPAAIARCWTPDHQSSPCLRLPPRAHDDAIRASGVGGERGTAYKHPKDDYTSLPSLLPQGRCWWPRGQHAVILRNAPVSRSTVASTTACAPADHT
jgi:hypothetical protein